MAPPPQSPEARIASEALMQQVLEALHEQDRLPPDRVRCAAVYAQHGSEIDPADVALSLRQRGTAICYPRVISRPPPVLGFFLCEGLDQLRLSALGLREPPPEAAAAPPVDVFIVPGLGFDQAGCRIGYGGGFYDAALRAQPLALRIAVGFDFQVVPAIPVGDLDEPVDLVVTPTRRCVTSARPAVSRAAKEGSP
jgi:5-formyltetrahydrofolate cyclo-ligase